jgi:hypothetical protein
MTDLNLYEEQLKQIQAAKANCTNEEDLKNLQSLEKDVKELLNLSFLESLENENTEKNQHEAEIETSNNQQVSEFWLILPQLLSTSTKFFQNLHKDLLNQKCRAPFSALHGNSEFHNAFVADIVEEDCEGDILVKVFFLNPVVERMKPCEFYFSGKCDYEENCRFSHGEIFPFSKLRPYEDPNFQLLKAKCHVLGKNEKGLWKPAAVIDVCHDQKTCKVKLQGGKSQESCFSDILPPDDTLSDDSDLSDSSSDNDLEQPNYSNVFQVDDNFGEWEKFTKGFGSKMMEKLGYVKGEGLGKRSDGICEPVSARIYIQGKSLDYNMQHNERKAQETVEEKIRKESKRQQKISEQNYARKETDAFSIINSIGKASTSTVKLKVEDIKTQSKSQLNIANFKIEEEIKRRKKELDKIKDSLKRQKSSAKTVEVLQKQIDSKQREIDGLQRKLDNVHNEQKSRSDKSKLSIF